MEIDDAASGSRETNQAGTETPVAAAATGTETDTDTDTGTQRERPSDSDESASGDPAAEETLNVAFNCHVSALYNKAREGHLDGWHRWMMFLVIVSGSGAVLIFSNGGDFYRLVLLIPAVLGAADIAFSFSIRARDHALFARRHLDIWARAGIGAAEERELKAEFLQVCAEEPPPFEALHAVCYNQACRVARRDDAILDIPRHHRWLKNCIRFSGREYKPPEKK